MKELSIEEKAKAYDEAIEKAKSKLHYADKPCFVDIKEIFPELKENEDERIRKALLGYIKGVSEREVCKETLNEWIAWLEKQGEHAKFRDSIQVGNKVTRNQDGVLVNLSQLKRVAKPAEVQGEQKPAWSEEDDKKRKGLIKGLEDRMGFGWASNPFSREEYISWLKSIRPQSQWKPSDEHYELEEFAKIVRCNLTGISKAVQKLFEAKYLQLTGNKMYGGFKD